MEGISRIAIELCIIRIRQKMVNKDECFSILNDTFKDIHYRKGTPTQIYEEIINYVEITNDNTRKLNPQKIKWIEEWAKMKENELLPFPKKQNLPKELDTDEAQALFQNLINWGYCVYEGNLYKWESTPSLFGYFVDVASNFLNIRPSNNRLPWKIFKIAFQCSDKDISTAKQAVNAYKNKGLSEPEGFLNIKKACK